MSAELAAAKHLVALYDERIRLTREMANHPRPTGEMAQAILDKGAELDEASEEFRRKFYPRRHRVIVGLGQVITCSKSMRSLVLVFDGSEATR